MGMIQKKLKIDLLKYSSSFCVGLFFLLFLLLGLWLYGDYGVSTDEPAQRAIGQTSLSYIANLFAIPFLLDYSAPLSNPASVFLGQKDRDYGVAFELPAELLIKLLHLTGPDIYLFRHLLTFLLFFIAVFYIYKIAKVRYSDWRIGLLAALFLILSPRIFGDSFFNDKDLVFLSVFVLGTYTLVRLALNPTLRTALWHALACGVAIDVRIMAVILPVATVAVLLSLLLRKKSTTSQIILILFTYLLALVIFVVAFWPWLWLDPLGNFLTAFRNMAHFPHVIDMYFMGQIVSSGALPWYYVPVWVGVTTPILYLVLFFLGSSATIIKLASNGKRLWGTNQELLDLIFLGLFAAPLIAVIVLESVLYNGWRQMYFIYPAFILIAVRGFYCLWVYVKAKKRLQVALMIVIVSCLASTCYWMVRWHPYQYLYFNQLAGDSSTRFDVDYWAVAYRRPLEKIIGQDRQLSYSIYHKSPFGKEWGVWQIDFLRNLHIFSMEDRQRIIVDRPETCSDYIFTVLVGNQKQYSQNPGFELFHELKVDGQIIYSVFKRKVQLYDFFSPAVGKSIDFSSPHIRCFLKKGWADNTEAWGTWSLGNEALVSIFMPPGKPKSISLDLRAFVSPKQPNQEVELGINGVWQKK